MGPSITDPAEWTAGESNPDLRRAMPASSRWTSSPIDESRYARELNPVFLLTKGVCCRNTCRPVGCESPRQDSNLRYPACKAGVFAARRRDDLQPVAEVGVEPTGTSPSDWRLCQFAYPAVA